jgi:hypothetical protein
MKLALQQLPATTRGPARMKYLASDAAAALLKVEEDTDGLIYTDFWRDGVASLVSLRLRKTSQLPSYSPHNYGLALDIDLVNVLKEKAITYETLLYIMKKRGWYCHRRDGRADQPEANHFNFLGEKGDSYLSKTTMDPATWGRPGEMRISEVYGDRFIIDTKTVQVLLARVGFYVGPTTGAVDMYTREAVMAFQRAWDLVVDGVLGIAFCRALAFVTAELDLSPPPALVPEKAPSPASESG